MKDILVFLLFSACSTMNYVHAIDPDSEMEILANREGHKPPIFFNAKLEISDHPYEVLEGPWDNLPPELRMHILSFLNKASDVVSFSRASKSSQALVEELYRQKIKEDSPLPLSTSSPWQTTYIFRGTLLTILKGYQDTITSKKKTGSALGEYFFGIASILGIDFLLGGRGKANLPEMDGLIHRIEKFRDFCEKEKLPHAPLLDSILSQHHLADRTAEQNALVKKIIEGIDQKDEVALELALILHSLDFHLLGKNSRFNSKPGRLASLIENLIEKGRTYLLCHELLPYYSDSLLNYIGEALLESETPSASIKKNIQTQAVDFFARAARNNYLLAQSKLGLCYRLGKGVPQDFNKAVEWFRLAAEQGHAEAQFNLGACYWLGKGMPQDFIKAVEWFRLAAEQGRATAQFNLGVCYKKGEGVPQDFNKAVEWFRLAAEQGHAQAQFNLGACYKEGEGVLQDFEKALKWCTRAAEQGLAAAQSNLGTCYQWGEGVPRDHNEAVKWYTFAALQGYADAQYNLGFFYELGWGGIVQDRDEAVTWYTRAAEQGNAVAQFKLGVSYEWGYMVVRDLKEAVKWYRLAAEQGYEEAQSSLRVLLTQ